jgi:hypothetical protein
MPEKGIFRHDFIRLILVSLPPQPSLLDHSRCIVRSFFPGSLLKGDAKRRSGQDARAAAALYHTSKR